MSLIDFTSIANFFILFPTNKSGEGKCMVHEPADLMAAQLFAHNFLINLRSALVHFLFDIYLIYQN